MLVLGSQSPRRKEILKGFSLEILQVGSNFDEDSVPFVGDPEKQAVILAEKKSETLKERFPDQVIITADTIVWHQGVPLGKPSNKEEAFQMLSSLSNSTHIVFTGVAVRKNDRVYTGVEKTEVEFFPMTDTQIRAYQKACHSYDKAGGYAIQSQGGLIVKSIRGSYDNVIGLPLHTLNSLLNHFEIDLWDYV